MKERVKGRMLITAKAYLMNKNGSSLQGQHRLIRREKGKVGQLTSLRALGMKAASMDKARSTLLLAICKKHRLRVISALNQWQIAW